MFVFRCKNCRFRLTDLLIELVEIPDYHSIHDEDYFEKGRFHKLVENNSVYYLLNVSDGQYLINHADTNRFSGCCGPSPDGLCNKICRTCKAEIGRETTECIFPHYVQVNAEQVTIEIDEIGFYRLLCHPVSQKLRNGLLPEIESLYLYSNKSEAMKMLSDEVNKLSDILPADIALLINH